MKKTIIQLIKTIEPYDKTEKEHIQNALEWINSTNLLYRIKKPDIPSKHLVSYFILFDNESQKLLLVDHKKAKLLLPAGGHVEKDENPKDTVVRECLEELAIDADFITKTPFFITVTETLNTNPKHTDVSLWYILKGRMKQQIKYDKREFEGYHWLSLNEILSTEIKKLDPHMHRFTNKLITSSFLNSN